MRISDWSSDVCSSDLPVLAMANPHHIRGLQANVLGAIINEHKIIAGPVHFRKRNRHDRQTTGVSANCKVQRRDRKSVVEGKSVSVRVDLGGRLIIKKKKHKKKQRHSDKEKKKT